MIRLQSLGRDAVVASLVLAIACSTAPARATCHLASADVAAPAKPDWRVVLLVEEAGRAHTWRVAWTAINGGLTVLPIGGLFVLSSKDRPDLIVSASGSAVSTLFTWFWPLDVEADAEQAARLRPTAPHDCDATLDRLVAHSADDEASRFTWPWHVGNFVTALIPAAIIWFGFHDRLGALAAVIGGAAEGEIELLTQPTGLVDLPRPTHTALRVAPELGRGVRLTYRIAF